MEFFQSLQNVLEAKAPDLKFDLFADFYEEYRSGRSFKERDHVAPDYETPSYNSCLNVVPPSQVPQRKNPSDREGRISLLHSIAHIEYSAVDLALDAALRFKGLPDSFYDDWVETAREEIDHFRMVQKLLQELGSTYGDLPVHSGLFMVSMRTKDLMSRMAVVPRYLEAGGLDANSRIMKKFQEMTDPMGRDILKALQVILDEEIDHVRRGDRWFTHACSEEGVSKSVYFDIVQKIFGNNFRQKSYMNVEARRKAGFSEEEIARLSA